jgi:hypothetical protein
LIGDSVELINKYLRRNRELFEWKESCPYYYFILKSSFNYLFNNSCHDISESENVFIFPSELYLFILELLKD